MAGIWDKTLIALYTLDGSRATTNHSYGNEGKNGVMLACGMIKGGYYVDIMPVSGDGDGHVFSYHAPDVSSGEPNQGFTDNGGRLPGAAAWRTVLKALDIPDEITTRYAETSGVQPLRFALK